MRTRMFMVAALTALSIGNTACSNSSKLTFVVSNIPSDAKTVSLKARINNADYKIETVPVSQSEGSAKLVNVEIPFDVRGLALYITINAANDKCLLAEWTGSVGSIDGKDYTVNSPLSSIKDVPINQDLFAVTSIAADNVWAAGTNSTVAHWDGCHWTRSQIDEDGLSGLIKIYYHPKSGLWAVGSNSSIAKYDNNKWTKLDIPNLWSLTGDLYKRILWTDIAFSEGSTEQLVAIGISTFPGAMPGQTTQFCRALKITKSGGKYALDIDVEPKLCNVLGAQPIRTIANTTFVSSPFYPARLISFSNGLVMSGHVYVDRKPGTGPQVTGLKYTAFVRFQDQVSLSNPIARFINPAATDDPQGSGGPIWGTSADDFWLGSPQLQHVTTPSGQPGSPTAKMVDWVYPASAGVSVSNLWGASARDFWIIGIGALRLSQVLHINDRSGSTFTEDSIKPTLFEAPLNNITVTNVSGTSLDDVWFVGYGGYRVRYNNSKYTLF